MLIRLLITLALAAPASAQTVHSLDKVPHALKTPEAKRAFAQAIEGKPSPDGLGVKLPSGLLVTGIARLLVPPGDRNAPTLIGARPVPDQPDRFVAIACTGGEPLTPSADQVCDATKFGAPHPDLRAYVGLLEARPGVPPHLLARPVEIDTRVAWTSTILGDAPDAADDAPGGVLTPDTLTGFDLAPYWIAPGERAFGLKAEWSVGYAGGGAEFGALFLFAVEDGAVRQILATPMWFSKNIAGDWHKNGTRDHDLSEGAAVLVATTHATNGHFDLVQRLRKGRASRTFKWSSATQRYEAAAN